MTAGSATDQLHADHRHTRAGRERLRRKSSRGLQCWTRHGRRRLGGL